MIEMYVWLNKIRQDIIIIASMYADSHQDGDDLREILFGPRF